MKRLSIIPLVCFALASCLALTGCSQKCPKGQHLQYIGTTEISQGTNPPVPVPQYDCEKNAH